MERLRDITEEEALREGIPDDSNFPLDNPAYCSSCKGTGFIGALDSSTLGFMEIDCPDCDTPIKRFANLWNSTIKKADLDRYGWNANPWVWVIEFEGISKEEAYDNGHN